MNSLDPPFVDLHAATWIDHERFELRQDAKRFENWESFFAGKIGLSVAVDYALDIGLSAIHDRIWYLAETFRNRLAELPGITVQDQGEDKCGIVTFTKAHENASENNTDTTVDKEQDDTLSADDETINNK